MIAQISGTLIDKTSNHLLLMTAGGVGYQIYATPKLLDLAIGTTVTVSTYCHVKEDMWVLFGFDSDLQKKLFIQLIAIDGVGPKTAFLILSNKSIAEISQAILSKDVRLFESISGVGKKTAARIILELSSKFGEVVDIKTLLESDEVKLDNTAIETLTALGYPRKTVIAVLRQLGSDLGFDELIKKALKKLSENPYG